MRWRKLGLESHVALERTRFFPKFFTGTSNQIAWIFMTCLEQMLHNANHWDVTLNISKTLITEMVEFLIKSLSWK